MNVKRSYCDAMDAESIAAGTFFRIMSGRNMKCICKTIRAIMMAAACAVFTTGAVAAEEAAVAAEPVAEAATASGQHMAPADVTRDGMTTLELEKLTEFLPPAPGAYLQGGTVTSTGFLMAFLPGESSAEEASADGSSPGNPLLLLDTDTWQVAASVSEELSHANDLCYVPADREIYVLPMDLPQIIVLDEDTLSVKRIIDTPQTYHAIGFDEAQDCFAAICSSGKGSEKRLTCDILDHTCTTVLNSFPVDTNLTYQGLAVHDSKVYYSCWKKGEGKMVHKTVYDDLLQVNDNVVYVYDYEGNLADAMLIKMPEGYNTFEVEAISFLGDRMILQFNENLADDTNTLMIGVFGAAAG